MNIVFRHFVFDNMACISGHWYWSQTCWTSQSRLPGECVHFIAAQRGSHLQTVSIKRKSFNIRFSEPARLSTRRKPFVLTKTAGQEPTIKVFHTNHRATKHRNSDAWLRLWTALSLDVDGVVAQDFFPHRLYFVDARDRADLRNKD